jgi:alpha-D-ribose 1-methylphosphonate 5-triphosphate synthase subunit PhnH
MTTVSLGFGDPIFDAQAVFKVVMMAMARPGEVKAIGPLLVPPPPLTPAAAAVALALLDYETPVWLDALLHVRPEAAQWIKFHTGARFTARADEAAFAFVSAPLAAPPINGFALGTLEYPDRSATLVMQVERLEGGKPLLLRGPGIESSRVIAPTPLPDGFGRQLAENHAIFPRGVDIIFASPEGVAALPRSASVTEND